MSDEQDDEHPGAKAMEWFHQERDETDARVAKLKKAGDVAEGTKGVMIEAAVVNAQSNRELAAATITSAEMIDFAVKTTTKLMTAEADLLAARLDQLGARIGVLTERSDKATNRLAYWTMLLAFGTLLLFAATAGLVYATLRLEPPQVITISAPSTPPIVVTPAPPAPAPALPPKR